MIEINKVGLICPPSKAITNPSITELIVSVCMTSSQERIQRKTQIKTPVLNNKKQIT